MTWLAETMEGDYLFGETVSAADCYLFVMLLWAKKNNVEAQPSWSLFVIA